MALGDPYATLEEIKVRMQIEPEIFDADLTRALSAASRGIETYCNRQFNLADSATAREYDANAVFGLRGPTRNLSWATVDDFHTAAGLVVESGDGYTATWTPSDYQLKPLNGIVDGQTGWPFWRIDKRPGGLYSFDDFGLRVTAQWGWAAVPAPVKEACLILAADIFQIKDAPFGVKGMDEFGVIRIRGNRMAESLLATYVKHPIAIGR